LDAEEIWDSLHAAAGTLNPKEFGPPVMPALSKEELSGLFDEKSWKANPDPAESNRRAIYLFERRTFLYPLLDNFDPPDVMASCPRRFMTTVPTQALALLNSRIVHGQARGFARRLLAECGAKLEAIPARAWILAFHRPITGKEQKRALAFLLESKRSGAIQPRRPTEDRTLAGSRRIDQSAETEETDPNERSENSNESAITRLCLALFNANEFVFVD
jgi:hypothetical protein